jgi:tetratricopeptide (TPR) repeat protein
MYPDKMGIFNLFCHKLMSLNKYEDVQRMLSKFPDRDKENVNYFYYRIFKSKGDTDKAFFHLKRELDLYSHRVNLIPELITLNKLSTTEIQEYIDKILAKAGHAIDTYYHVANAYFVQENYREAERYIDLELELFPENRIAMQLKLNLFLAHYREVVSKAYYERNWKIFQSFMKLNKDQQLAAKMSPLFLVLNYVTLDSYRLDEIIHLKEMITDVSYREEFTRYLSFVTQYLEIQGESNSGEVIPKYEKEDYLSHYSTRKLAYEHFFAEARQMVSEENDQQESAFQLIEHILKYNPGDPDIFAFLDSLS